MKTRFLLKSVALVCLSLPLSTVANAQNNPGSFFRPSAPVVSPGQNEPSLLDFVFQMLRIPGLANRAAANNPNVTATVTETSPGLFSTQVSLTTPSSQVVSISSTTERSPSGFSSTATITPPSAPGPITVSLDVARTDTGVTSSSSVTGPAGNTVSRTTTVTNNDTTSTITSTVTRNGASKTVTRTVPRREPPPRG